MSDSLAMLPWFEGNFLKSTVGWTFVQRSLYRCLLAASWELEGLPTDEEELGRIAGTSPEQWAEGWRKVKAKFFERDGRLFNKKLEEIRADAISRREAKRRAGRTGGEASGKARAKQPLDDRSTAAEAKGVAETKPTSTSTSTSDKKDSVDLPSPVGTGSSSPPAKAGRSAAQVDALAVEIPQDWQPNEINREWLVESGMSVTKMVEVIGEFVHYWRLSKIRKSPANWQRTFFSNPLVKKAVASAAAGGSNGTGKGRSRQGGETAYQRAKRRLDEWCATEGVSPAGL